MSQTVSKMFGYSTQSVNDIKEALSKPDCSVDTLLQCHSITSQFRNGNPDLVEYLRKEANMKRLLELIHTNKEREVQKAILALFQTSNTSLHRVLAESITLAEYAASVADTTLDNTNYSIGIISRIFSRAFDLWPDDMSEIFRLSKTLYRTVISHIDNLCIFHSVQSLISETHKEIWLFMWRCFQVLVDNSPEYKLVQKRLPIPENLVFEPGVITKYHKEHIIELLFLFFKLKLRSEEEFAQNVMKYLYSQELNSSLINLALTLSPDQTIAERIMNILDTNNDWLLPITEKCIEYLKHAIQFVPASFIVKVIEKVLTDNNVSNFAQYSAKALIVTAQEQNILQQEHIESLKKIIMSTYNAIAPDKEPTLLPFIMVFGYLIKIEEPENEYDPYTQFRKNIILPYHDSVSKTSI